MQAIAGLAKNRVALPSRRNTIQGKIWALTPGRFPVERAEQGNVPEGIVYIY